jgi:hypothetical protein
MPALQFKSEPGDKISLFPVDVNKSSWSDIESLMLSHGAMPRGTGFTLSPLSLYFVARDLGHLMRQHRLDALYGLTD